MEDDNETIDTNIENYSVEDILEMLNLTDNSSEYQIKDAANAIISKMKEEGNEEISLFFQDALNKVLENLYNDNDNDDDNDDNDDNDNDNYITPEENDNDQFDETTQLGNWWKNEYTEQTNKVQTDKYTNRKHTVQVFEDNNGHFQMKRDRLGINQSHGIPIVQDVLNPNLKNKTTRIISVDSQYRQTIFPYANNDVNTPSFNTDYTFNLSERLQNVVSIKVNSIQIPTTWNTFEHSLGNTCFDCSGHTIRIEPGNYSIENLVTEISNNLVGDCSDVSISIAPSNTINKKIQFNTTSAEKTITFYQDGGFTDCLSCGPGMKVNQNLGWNLGVRQEPDSSGNISINIKNLTPVGTPYILEVPPDLYGPKYFMLVIDDYNNNIVNNGLVNMKDTTSKLSLPSYYNSASKSYDNTQNIECPVNNGNSTKTPYMKRSSPRQLTQAQVYSVNEIITNRNKQSNRVVGPTTSNVMAFIPLKGITQTRPDPYIEYGPSIQSNERTYFGPVDIERMRVKLIDDKGNLVNLNGNDWSFSLTVEQLYQY